jgi:hypothetical protein
MRCRLDCRREDRISLEANDAFASIRLEPRRQCIDQPLALRPFELGE